MSSFAKWGGLIFCWAIATSAYAGDLYLVEDLHTSRHFETAETEGLQLLDVNTASDWADSGSGHMSSQSGGRIWYGGEMLLWTGGSLLLAITGNVLVATGTESGVFLAGLGSLGVSFSGMYVHAKYGYWGRAWGSLGLRVGVPIGAFYLGFVAASDDGWVRVAVAGISAVVGAIVGHTFDYMMAYRDRPGVTNEPAVMDEAEFDVRVSPYVSVTEDQQSAGLLVAF